MTSKVMKYKNVWVFVGVLMVLYIIHETLTPSPIEAGLEISDKILHIIGYSGVMGWFVQIFHGRVQRIYIATGFVCMGVVLEYMQGWGGVRQYEVADMLANALGVLFGWAIGFTRLAFILVWIDKKISVTAGNY